MIDLHSWSHLLHSSMKKAREVFLCPHFSEKAKKIEARKWEVTEQVNDGINLDLWPCISMYSFILHSSVLCCAVLSHSVVSDSVTPWTVAHQAPLSMGILQARVLEWVAIPYSRGSSQARDQTQVSHIAGKLFTIWAIRDLHNDLPLSFIIEKASPCRCWRMRISPGFIDSNIQWFSKIISWENNILNSICFLHTKYLVFDLFLYTFLLSHSPFYPYFILWPYRASLLRK